MKKYLFILLSLIFLPNIYACDYSIKSELKSLANNVNFNLEYQIINDSPTFKISITGINGKIYVIDENGNKYYEDTVIDNLSEGMKYKFYVHSVLYDFCGFGDLNTKTINTPFYNRYYNDKLCDNHKNDDICYRWNNVSMSYDEFKKKISSLEIVEPIVPDVPVKKYGIAKYMGLIVGGISIILGASIMIMKKKNIGF